MKFECFGGNFQSRGWLCARERKESKLHAKKCYFMQYAAIKHEACCCKQQASMLLLCQMARWEASMGACDAVRRPGRCWPLERRAEIAAQSPVTNKKQQSKTIISIAHGMQHRYKYKCN